MSKNITLLGASYSDVPAVRLPVTGGGTADFTDVSDTTAIAADVAQGKYFYLADGSRAEGTSSGGGGSVDITQDAQGYLVLGKNGDGGGGGGGGSVSPCPITLYTTAATGAAQYFFAAVQLSSANDYCQILTMRNYITSTPLSCYALPRLDTSAEYPYQIAVWSNYNNFRIYLNSSSTNCTTLYESSSAMYNLAIGCKQNAVVIIGYENMS